MQLHCSQLKLPSSPIDLNSRPSHQLQKSFVLCDLFKKENRKLQSLLLLLRKFLDLFISIYLALVLRDCFEVGSDGSSS